MSRDAGASRDARVAALLHGAPTDVVEVTPDLWGFGGLHGGLGLAAMAGSASRHAPGLELRAITGHYHRVGRGAVRLESRIVRTGRTTCSVGTIASTADGVCVTSTATFGAAQPASPPIAPKIPSTSLPADIAAQHDLFGKPPVMESVEVRPLQQIRPYEGSGRAELSAWVRLRSSDQPASARAVLFFLDALPPSYIVALREHRHVPTLEMSAHVSPGGASSPWVFIRTSTQIAQDGGWVTETADAWDESGRHVGRAQQLRLTLALR